MLSLQCASALLLTVCLLEERTQTQCEAAPRQTHCRRRRGRYCYCVCPKKVGVVLCGQWFVQSVRSHAPVQRRKGVAPPPPQMPQRRLFSLHGLVKKSSVRFARTNLQTCPNSILMFTFLHLFNHSLFQSPDLEASLPAEQRIQLVVIRSARPLSPQDLHD